MTMQHVAGILLAGGRSRRMGTDKALLTLPGSDQVSFLQRLTEVMLGACEELVLVTRDESQADGYARYVSSSVRIVVDEVRDCGPLMGIYTGLRVVQASYAFVCAVDTPLLQPSLLTFLLAQCCDDINWCSEVSVSDEGCCTQQRTGARHCPYANGVGSKVAPLVVPVVGGLPQVLLALYPRALLALIEGRLQAGRRDPCSLLEVAATRYIPEVQLREVDPDLRSFLNVNTPEELNVLRAMFEEV